MYVSIQTYNRPAYRLPPPAAAARCFILIIIPQLKVDTPCGSKRFP